jgi:excisionase family DNA binding protein
MTRPFPFVSFESDDGARSGVRQFEPLLNSEQAADLLQIHRKTLQKLARRGEIRGTQVGKLWRFRVSDLNAWFDQNQQGGCNG